MVRATYSTVLNTRHAVLVDITELFLKTSV